MKILSRYILRDYLANLLLGVLIFTFVLLLDRLFELVDLLINKGVGLSLSLRLLMLLLPASVTLTLPMSNLLATLLTFGQFSELNEITAMRASGLSAWSYIRSPLWVAFMSTLFLIPFNSIWAPHAHAYFRQLYLQVLQRNPLVRIEEKTFIQVGDYHLYVESKGRSSNRLRGVTIYKTPQEGAPLRIFADRGTASVDLTQGITLTLSDGHIEQVNSANSGRWFYTRFKTYILPIPFQTQKQAVVRSIQEMDSQDLRNQIQDLKQKGLPYPLFSCEMHLRDALAATPFLFAFLGIPLAISVHRGGKSIGFGMSLIIVTLYYALLMGGMGMGQRGLCPPWMGLWFGNVVLGIVGVALGWNFLRY